MLPTRGPTRGRLHIVTGKGGTGKTTCAAALAIALATDGRRVLIVEVEGRQGLAQLFDTAPLPYRETLLTHAPRRGEVFGLAIDPEEAMLEYLQLYYNLKRAGRALRSMGAIDFVTTIAPGLRDVLLTGKLKEAVARKDKDGRPAYDAVVLDAPPTGRIRQFLDVTKDVVGLTKVGPIHRQSQSVIDTLHRADTLVHLVTLLEELPVQETLDAAADLLAGEFHLGAVLVNRTRPDLVPASVLVRGRPDRTRLEKELATVGIGGQAVPDLAREVTAYAQRQKMQSDNLTRLRPLGLPTVSLPEFGPPVDMGAVYDLAELLHEEIL